MADLTFTAVVDESRVLRLPPETPLGEVEVVLQGCPSRGNLEALRNVVAHVPQSQDPGIWQQAREELARMRDED